MNFEADGQRAVEGGEEEGEERQCVKSIREGNKTQSEVESRRAGRGAQVSCANKMPFLHVWRLFPPANRYDESNLGRIAIWGRATTNMFTNTTRAAHGCFSYLKPNARKITQPHKTQHQNRAASTKDTFLRTNTLLIGARDATPSATPPPPPLPPDSLALGHRDRRPGVRDEAREAAPPRADKGITRQ